MGSARFVSRAARLTASPPGLLIVSASLASVDEGDAQTASKLANRLLGELAIPAPWSL